MTEKIAKLKSFLQEVYQETRRITWPTTREIAGATGVVIFTTIAMAGLLAVYDWLVSMTLKVVLR